MLAACCIACLCAAATIRYGRGISTCRGFKSIWRFAAHAVRDSPSEVDNPWSHRYPGAAVTLAFPASTNTQTKVALVIGNGAYKGVPELANPTNDATAVAAAFLRLGFSVRLVTDASYEEMRRALLEFSQKARDSEMAIVFFAGHGIEFGGENWLIPSTLT